MSQHYSEAYKRELVARAKANGNVSQTAHELGGIELIFKRCHDLLTPKQTPS